MAAPIPMRVRGIDYPSGAACARALGLTPSAIYMANENGTLEKLGDFGHTFELGPSLFPSRCAASRAIGKHDCFVRDALTGGDKAKIRLAALFVEYWMKDTEESMTASRMTSENISDPKYVRLKNALRKVENAIGKHGPTDTLIGRYNQIINKAKTVGAFD